MTLGDANFSLFTFASTDPKLLKLIENLQKRIGELEEKLREKERVILEMNFENKLKIKDLEFEIKNLKKELKKAKVKNK